VKSSPLPYLVKARALNVLKRYEQAYQAALDAEKHYGNCVAVYSTKAGILEQLGRNSEAADAYRQSDQRHPC
jgi:predicted RNA polymerase sigma factor